LLVLKPELLFVPKFTRSQAPASACSQVCSFPSSSLGTQAWKLQLPVWVILVSCFAFLAYDKPYGTMLWATVTSVVLVAGIMIAKRRSPERAERGQADSEMEIILYLAESSRPDLHIHFQRPREEALGAPLENEVYITFFSPRQGIPPKLGANHFRLPIARSGLYLCLVALLKVVEYELTDRDVAIHFGWPMSSWLDRLAVGVMVFNLMRLPRHFPKFNFVIRYRRQ
jgi:hypothetical protein